MINIELQNPRSLWFVEEVDKAEHFKRISNVVDIKQYLLRMHEILNRKDFEFKGEVYKTAKIIFNTLKSILKFHVGYVVGNSVSLTGDPEIVKAYNSVYKKGILNKIDYKIVSDLVAFGNAFEYSYVQDGKIKSKVIANEDSYPVYDEHCNYVAFVEYWNDALTGHKHHIVYTPTMVRTYEDERFVNEYANLTGLPTHYASLTESEYNFFGEGIMEDLMPIMDKIELLLSKLDDAITNLSLNPLGVSSGQRIDESIPKDISGVNINLEDGGQFNWASAQMDYQNIKLLLDSLKQELYAVAGVPAAVIGQGNISNVSEVSLKLLFGQMDVQAKETIHVLKDGFYKRFEYIRKLLAFQGKTFTDEQFDSLDVIFSINRPVNTESMLKELKTQYDMGAISKQTIIDISPYTVDTASELKRLEEEQGVQQ